MLSGTPAFTGDNISETLAALLRDVPGDLASFPHAPSDSDAAPPDMEKDRRRRLESASDMRLEIEDALSAAPAGASERCRHAAAAMDCRSCRRHRAHYVVDPAILYFRGEASPPAAPIRTSSTPGTNDPFSFALSPDGRQVVLVASGDGP
jgi:hypothetical protein